MTFTGSVGCRSFFLVRLLSAVLVLLAQVSPLSAAPAPARPAPAAASREVRALWVARTSLTTPASVAAMVKSARAGGFNTLLVQVRGRGDAYYNGGLEPRAAALASQPDSFDPLGLTLKLAHDQGLRVHAWVNVALVSSAVELPASKAHLVHRHPEWLMVPKALARDMVLLDPQSQLYLDKLMRWTRTQGGEVEGLYASPVPADAASATVAVVADLVARYPLDGVHLDYVRYPNEEFDYSRASLEAFRDDVTAALTPAERRERERAIGSDVVAWTEVFPERWREFRRHRLTMLVTRLRDSVKARRPAVVFSAAVAPDPKEASSRRLQDWAAWLQSELLDVVCPMAYATDAAVFSSQVASARQAAGTRPVWAGIGAYRLSSRETVENIKIARRLGASGIVLFSYDSLVNLPRGLDYLAHIARAAFAQEP
jgi:uncharacterized lipoprotein YddW (UPF0748 family)